MKKMFTLLFILGSLTSVFAQNGYHTNDWNRGNNDRQNGNPVYSNSGGHYDQHSNDYGNSSTWNREPNRNGDRYHQQTDDRDNRGYDRRDNDYGYGRSANPYPRDNRNVPVVRDQRQKTKAFSGGVVVGAVAGVLLGVLLSK